MVLMPTACAPPLLQQCAAGGRGRGPRLLHGVQPRSGARHARLLARGRVPGLVRPMWLMLANSYDLPPLVGVGVVVVRMRHFSVYVVQHPKQPLAAGDGQC
jgi:hypothetical protein